MTTIGILSDTHGFIHPEVIDVINQCDFAIHAGDIIDEKTLIALKPKQKLIAVRGNNDAHIEGLSAVATLNFPTGRIMIEHGHQHGAHKPCHSSLRRTYADAKVIVYGHSHKQVIDKSTAPWVINPGAAGLTRNHGGAKCLLMRVFDDQEWQIEPYIFD